MEPKLVLYSHGTIQQLHSGNIVSLRSAEVVCLSTVVPFHVVQHFQGLVTQPCYAIFKFVHFSFRFVPSFTHELQINFSQKALLSILYCVWPELVSLPLLTLVWPSCPRKTSMNEISFRLLSLLQDVSHYHYTALESGVL